MFMANGTDLENLVACSRVRSGLKRELAFALKAQAEISEPLGRTRARGAQIGVIVAQERSGNASNKKLKSLESIKNGDHQELVEEQTKIDGKAGLIVEQEGGCASEDEDEPKSSVVDMGSDDVELESKNELKDDAVRPIYAGDPKSDVSDDEPKNHSHRFDSTMEDGHQMRCVEGDDGELSVLMHDNVSVENALAEKIQTQRFTPLGFKRKGMPEVEDGKIDVEVVKTIDAIGVNMPERIKLTKSPTKLKELLATGILEGLCVKYLRGPRTRGPKEKGLLGVIKGTGILCYCSTCNGLNVISPNLFELHAGSANKRPPEYTFLENGNSLRDVLNACKGVPLDALEACLRNFIGHLSIVESIAFSNDNRGKISLPSDLNIGLKESHQAITSPTETANTTDRSPKPNLYSKAANEGLKSSVLRSKSQGRLTRKDLRLHKLVFEEDVLPDGTEVAYYSRGQKLLVGYKKGFGILCTCCNSEVSPSQFEAHAGWASRRKPYLHIYTSNGVSLHELSVSLSRGRKFSANENDDLCTICADGGDLLCCDRCPRAFHSDCITLSSTPGDSWYCKYCESQFQQERVLERNANAVAAGRIAGVDPIEQITRRCIRIATTLGSDFGGCVFCRGHDFSKEFGPRTVMLCDQCEREFHVGCMKEHNMVDLKELPKEQWFCCISCRTIHSNLEKFVAAGEKQLPQSLLDVVKKKHEEKNTESGANIDIRWRLLKGKMASDETRPLLSKAVSIFHERFDPILEPGTNRDFIPSMVYGRDLRDHEFGNMFCAVLTVNSVVVSAGIFRILGEEVAELPLVATLTDCQGMGYFQCLFSCIVRLLGSLNVKNLVLPAADEAESIWTKKFCFNKLSQHEFYAYKKDHSILMTFHGTSMLHKLVPNVEGPNCCGL